MLLNTIKRFVREDDGMEMVEWAIVGVVFAIAAAVFWTDLATAIDTALDDIEGCIDGSDTSCTTG
jgi:Flp pilus assembly pilin Flp